MPETEEIKKMFEKKERLAKEVSNFRISEDCMHASQIAARTPFDHIRFIVAFIQVQTKFLISALTFVVLSNVFIYYVKKMKKMNKILWYFQRVAKLL